MPFGAVAGAVASAAISSGISALTSSSQSGAVDAGVQQANGISEKTVAEGRDNYTRDRTTYQPFVDTGTNALAQYANLLGVNGQDAATSAMSNFTASPGFNYQVQQGLRAVDAGAASRGMLRSGATLKAEQALGANLANQDFSQYFGRLNSLAQYGLQGASGQAGTTGTFNNLLTGQANQQQSNITSGATQDASIYGNLGKTLGDQATGLVKNGLYDYGKTGTNEALGGNSFNGGGTSVQQGLADPSLGFTFRSVG